MEIHIGNIIKEHLIRIGMTKSEFARRINSSSQNVYNIFSRPSLDTDLLAEISTALNINFFSYYQRNMGKKYYISEPEAKYMTTQSKALVKKLAELNRMLKKSEEEIKVLQKENDYLREINGLLREKLNKKGIK